MITLNFKQWLESDYINPDTAFGVADDYNFANDKIIPFIFSKDGEMYYGETEDTHWNILTKHAKLRAAYEALVPKYGFIGARRKLEEEGFALFGRVGHEEYDLEFGDHSEILLVSLWGDNPNLFDQLLKKCLNKLEQDSIIDQERDLVSTLNHGTILIRDLYPAPAASAINIQKQQAAQALHLLPPKEKMAQLKAAGWTPKKNSWQTATDSNKITTPGHKFWAINSESSQSWTSRLG